MSTGEQQTLYAPESTIGTASRPGLRDLPGARRLPIGTIAAGPLVLAGTDGGRYVETIAREFNLLGCENDLKMYKWHGPNDIDWSGSDAVAETARAHGMRMRGHVLVYSGQVPGWLEQGVASGEISPDDLRSLTRNYITTVVRRYADVIDYWDVLNEAFDDEGALKHDWWWTNLGGDAYVETIFRWAREADPNAELYYNDYANDQDNVKSQGILRFFTELKERGVPVDGIGFQCHFGQKPSWRPDWESIRRNVANIAEAGFVFQVTENDAWVYDAEPDYDAQTEWYRGIVDLCLTSPNCRGYMAWGFSDAYSWLPKFLKTLDIDGGNGMLLDACYEPKSAYHAVAKLLSN